MWIELKQSMPRIHRNTRGMSASIIGNIIEWYDYTLFACLAPVLAELFFPNSNHIVSLLTTFSVFAIGFAIRPLGAIVFGHLGDRLGRAKTLKLTIALISLPSLGMAVLPTYQQIGIYATVLMILLRLLQGLCIGGEFAGAMIYLTETAPPGRRAIASSMTNNGSNIGILIATAVSALTAHFFNPQLYNTYGWRIPFIFGGVIGLIGLWLRSDIKESDIFIELMKNVQKNFVPIKLVLREHKNKVIKIALLLAISACGDYALMNYIGTYLNSFVGYSLADALQIQMIFIFVTLLFIPLCAWLADQYGLWNVLFFSCVGFLLCVWPCFYLLKSYHSWLVLSPLIIFYSAEQATTPALIVENFPAQTRYTGVSLGYNLSMALIGGTAPLLNTWLIHYFNNRMMIAIYIIVCALVSLLTLLFFIPRDKLIKISH